MEIVGEDGAVAPPFDPAKGKQSFGIVAPRVEAVAPGDVIPITVNLQDAAHRGVFLGRWVNEPSRRARFDKLHADLFDPAALDGLEDLGWATYYAQVESAKAAATADTRQIPAELASAGYAQARRMGRAADYWLSDEPTVALELASIRQGRGHNDLASDLLRYADLFEDHAALLSVDTKNVRPDDPKTARELADRILEAISDSQQPTQRQWRERSARLWTLLKRDYDEVLKTAQWLWRSEPHVTATLQSIHVPLRRRAKAKATASAPEVQPAPAEPQPV